MPTSETGDADEADQEALGLDADRPRRLGMTGEPVRIQKALADAAVSSRRAAEVLVAAGRVTVNGERATSGQRVESGVDRIAVDGRIVGERPRAVHLALHKPAGVTATVADRHAERTVIDLVPAGARQARRSAVSRGSARPRLGGAAAAHQRRRLGTARARIPATASSGSTPWASRAALGAEQVRLLTSGVWLEEGDGPGALDAPPDRHGDPAAAGGGRRAASLAATPLVSGGPDPGLEAPGAPDAGRRGCTRRASRAGAHRPGAPRRPRARRGPRAERQRARGPRTAPGTDAAGGYWVRDPVREQRTTRGPTWPHPGRHRRTWIQRQVQHRGGCGRELGYRFFDTGVLYRGLAWLAADREVPASDAAALVELIPHMSIADDGQGHLSRVMVDGRDVTERLHDATVDRIVSAVARVPEVREALLPVQRAIADEAPGGVDPRRPGHRHGGAARRGPQAVARGVAGGARPAALTAARPCSRAATPSGRSWTSCAGGTASTAAVRRRPW